MYKKITHNIVEEHYDHPLAAKIKAGLRPTITQKVRRDFEDEDIIFGRPTTEIFNKDIFKSNLENYLNTYTQKIIQISDTTAGTEEQLVDAYEELFDFVDNVKNFFNPFYNRELGERITTLFRQIASTSALLSHAAKAGYDQTPWRNSIRNAGLGFGGSMINYNTSWTNPVIQEPMIEYLTALITRTNAVKAGDSALIQQSTTDLYNKINVVKDVLYNGIIQQFPQRFTS
jgi:hypothetical protein